ncbi:MAG: hypothetical protein DRQ46_02820 [Gammaproteobacteria bacterium]|nr:MAG: hypothetical protein DRQ46_02820 [Gammaproteobacteria bacterium]
MADFDEKIIFRDWDEYNLGEDAQIDKYALDIEAEEQPHLMQKWLELLTKAQAELNKAKEVMANEEAKLLLTAKSKGIPDIPKPTDPIAKAWVHTQPTYRKAQRRKRKAENNVAYLQNARSVLEHRKTMIKVEADLWITGYFAKPQVTAETKDKLETERKQVHADKLSKSLKRRHLRQKENENGS